VVSPACSAPLTSYRRPTLSLFKAPAGNGEKYEYLNTGSYIGELVRFEEGRLRPPFADSEKEEPTQMVNWVWRLFQSDGTTPVMHDGNQVEYIAETSDATGRRSTASSWFSAHLKRTYNNESVDDTMAECIGKRVMLIITDKDSGWKKTDVFQAGV
jgi:hypothetical protein